jgi:hypothetical protein
VRSKARLTGQDASTAKASPSWRSKTAIALVVGLLFSVGFLLLSEHRLLVLGYLPYLLVLACPLLQMAHYGRVKTAHKSSRQAEHVPEA